MRLHIQKQLAQCLVLSRHSKGSYSQFTGISASEHKATWEGAASPSVLTAIKPPETELS